ncbi:MAG: Rne/Rng family ribonuclease, partial [Thermoanaerobaculia bacterium]
MSREIVINTTKHESRIAVVDEGQVAELWVERTRHRTIVGNIYKGRVTKVLPGMQSAFVDLGLERDAFLYVADVLEELEEFESETPEELQLDDVPHRPETSIADLLREGQEIVVQVSKDTIAGKGARITSHVTLPGRFLVYMPTVNHVGVSRRIEDEAERTRLKDILEAIRPQGQGGFIVRTAGEGRAEEEFRADLRYLTDLWSQIKRRAEKASAPNAIHHDLDLILRTIRDVLSSEFKSVWVDSVDEYQRIVEFLDQIQPQLVPRVRLYRRDEPIFDEFGIEPEIAKALKSKVWLKSGGYIVINQTEALVAIDVNTGKYVGKKNLEETVFRTNLEAAKEIVRQIRLRDLGGIIVLDFIDMEEAPNRAKLFETLENEIKKDRSKTKILQISEFGLIEMTRKRVRQSLERSLTQACPYCSG